MRADEYLVEEIIKLKKENEELKANNIDLSLQIVNLNKSNENEIILNKELIKIYNVEVYESNWKINQLLECGSVKIEDLNELLVNDEKLDEFYYDYRGFNKERAYKINEIFASYKIKIRNEKMWIYIYSDEDTYEMKCKTLYSDCNFETYEEALKYGREEARKVIEEVLERYNKEKK